MRIMKYWMSLAVLLLLPAGLCAGDTPAAQDGAGWMLFGCELEIVENLPADYASAKPEAAKHVFCDEKTLICFCSFLPKMRSFRKALPVFR